MLKERRLIAEQVAQQLFAAEAAIDAAIAATATLTGLMPSIRQAAGISAHIGQDALAEAAETCSMLVRARSSIVATHNALTVAQKQMGLGAVNFGGLVEKPLFTGESTRRIAAVASIERAA